MIESVICYYKQGHEAMLRSLLFIGLLFWPLPVSAQWEGRNWIDDWIERNFGEGAERVLADPGRVAAESARDSATTIRRGAPFAWAAVGVFAPISRVGSAAVAAAGLVPGEYNANAYVLDRMADAVDQLPPRYRPTPIIKKPSDKPANRDPVPEFEVIPPARVPQDVSPAARETQEAIDLPPVEIQGKLYPKERREGWSNWEKPKVEQVPEVGEEGVTPDEPMLQEETPRPEQAAVTKRPSGQSECRAAHGNGTPAYWRCLGNEFMARQTEESYRRQRCAQPHGNGTPAYWRCLGNEFMARQTEESYRRQRCAQSHGNGTPAYWRCLGNEFMARQTERTRRR